MKYLLKGVNTTCFLHIWKTESFVGILNQQLRFGLLDYTVFVHFWWRVPFYLIFVYLD